MEISFYVDKEINNKSVLCQTRGLLKSAVTGVNKTFFIKICNKSNKNDFITVNMSQIEHLFDLSFNGSSAMDNVSHTITFQPNSYVVLKLSVNDFFNQKFARFNSCSTLFNLISNLTFFNNVQMISFGLKVLPKTITTEEQFNQKCCFNPYVPTGCFIYADKLIDETLPKVESSPQSENKNSDHDSILDSMTIDEIENEIKKDDVEKLVNYLDHMTIDEIEEAIRGDDVKQLIGSLNW